MLVGLVGGSSSLIKKGSLKTRVYEATSEGSDARKVKQEREGRRGEGPRIRIVFVYLIRLCVASVDLGDSFMISQAFGGLICCIVDMNIAK